MAHSVVSRLFVLMMPAVITACAAPGAQYQSNVYKAEQVNQVQEAKTVEILAILPAKIEVSNEQGKKQAMFLGTLLGAAAGAGIGNAIGHNALAGGASGAVAGAATSTLVSDKTLVEGVQLTYVEEGRTLSSAQVGRQCEFKLGTAIVIATAQNETRIQPNGICPTQQTSETTK